MMSTDAIETELTDIRHEIVRVEAALCGGADALPLPSPGQYIAKRRIAAGLSLDDVALRFETTPPVSARSRAEWLARIEADIDPISIGTAFALHGCFRFDPHVLDALIAIQAGVRDVARPHLCRVCACSWHDACVDHAFRDACAWFDAAQTLCTNCVGKAAAVGAAAGLQAIAA
jgi:hypothetical protein